jgi:hypothetical protein
MGRVVSGYKKGDVESGVTLSSSCAFYLLDLDRKMKRLAIPFQ